MTRRHLVIAGTGRAGTSFLVRLLGDAGLDVGDFPEDAWRPEIRAGLERRFDARQGRLPYVVKDPWLWTYLDDVDPEAIHALVVPVRDLTQVAQSRLRNEWRGVPIEFAGTETFGRVAGGAVYDLSVRCQEDMAARGFYRLVEWAVAADVRLVLLSFSAMMADPSYVPSRLDFLDDDVRAEIRRRHAGTLEATKART